MPLRRTLLALALASLVTPAAAEEGGRSRSITSAESYLPMATLSTAVVSRFITSGILVVDVGIDVPNEALRTRATSLAPRLRDALRTALATYASTYYRDNTAPNPDQIGRMMQAAVDRVLGGPGARVLLGNVTYQHRLM